MRRPFALVLLMGLTAALLAGCLDAGEGRSLDDESEGLEPRGPIRIRGLAEILSPESGVRSGNGTRGDPYVIAGWYIDLTRSPTETAITLADLDVHVVVQNCKVKRSLGEGAIHVHRSKNVKIDKCKIVTAPKVGPKATSLVPPLSPANTSMAPTNGTSSTPTQTSPSTPTDEPPVPSEPTTNPNETSPSPPLPLESPSPFTPAAETPTEPVSAIVVEDSSNITIDETTVHGDADDALDSPPLVAIDSSTNVTVEDTTIESAPQDGILVDDSSDVSLENTHVSNNGGDGVVLSNSTDVAVENNTISGNGGDGVHADNVTSSSVSQNLVTDNGGYGVAIEGTDSQVSQNTVEGNGAQGGGGILVGEGSSVTVVSNGVLDNANYGIVVMPEATDFELRDNEAQGDAGGDRIIVPDPQDPEIVSQSNQGRVEPPGPGFDPRPPPKGNSPGPEGVVILAAVALALGGAGLWWVRRGR